MKKLALPLFTLLCFAGCRETEKDATNSSKENGNKPLVEASAFQFKTPALQVDFPDDSAKQAKMNATWHTNLTGFNNQGIAGNPWNATNDTNIVNYFNPAITGIPANSANVAIEWNALPGRIGYYYPKMKSNDIYAIADTGLLANGTMPNVIPENACTPSDSTKIKFGPYGPRGFQDEYCEWAVRKDANGNIIRIDFTCENPEYWNTLWNVDPNKVLQLYQNTLEIPQIAMEDLYVKDNNGNPVVDPSTGNNLYNPLNKWNSGSGGAMHLTSTPNTIQTEIGLATSASLMRSDYGDGIEALLCCGAFGQKNRNSDPQIGGSVNDIVRNGFNVTLANPPGLYIQKPDAADFARIKVPKGSVDPSTFWTTVRGKERIDEVDGLAMPGNYILHAKFEIPSELGYTISDLMMDGKKIQWGSEIAQLINMHIIATGSKGTTGQMYDCVGDLTPAFAAPLQLFHKAVFDGYSTTHVPNPAKFNMSLLSNSTYITPKLAQGAQGIPMVLTVEGIDLSNGIPTVTFEGGDITAAVLANGTINYAVPGNSYPGDYQTLTLDVTVAPEAKTGLRELYVTNAGQSQSQPMKALLYITK